jgi:transcriptional regulator with XRE-family HTH domain
MRHNMSPIRSDVKHKLWQKGASCAIFYFMQLNEAIRAARIDLGLSQKKLAEMAGIQRRQLATMEQGGNVTLKTLRKVLVHLPNLTKFSIDAVEGAVDRAPQPPNHKHQAFVLGTDLMMMLQSMLITLNSGGHSTLRELAALRRAKEILRRAFGYTPEQLAASREALWSDEFPGLATLIGDADESLDGLFVEEDEDADDTPGVDDEGTNETPLADDEDSGEPDEPEPVP